MTEEPELKVTQLRPKVVASEEPQPNPGEPDIGDVVTLNSENSILMTVVGFSGSGAKRRVVCQWFEADGTMCEQDIPPKCLKIVPAVADASG